MSELTQSDFVFQGTDFWTEQIKKAGVFDKLRFFNDVTTENRPPHPDSGYGEPVLCDVILDGKKADIYHTDHDDDGTRHRIFLHFKK